MAGLFRAFEFASLLVILALSVPLAVAQDDPLAVVQDGAPTFDPYPLRPADTSSPRDTLRSFNASTNEAAQAWRAGKAREAIVRPARQARETFDFSRLPGRAKRTKETESALLLKEILDRIELPPDDEIPGDEEVADEDDPVTRWAIPNTSITIAKMAEGPRAGEFLFTAETVDRLEEFYEQARHLPYKPGAMIGIYEDIAHSPGLMVPRSWAGALPAWSQTVVLGETIWQWLGLVIVAAAAFFLVRQLLRWGRRWDKRHRHTGALMRFGLPLGVFASVLVIYLTRIVLLDVVRLISNIWIVLSVVIWTLTFAGIGWLIVVVAGRIADAISDARHVRKRSIDRQLVHTLFRLLSLVLLAFLVLYAAGFFGVPLTPVVASLGVGGLAIALAVRPTLENIIGGLTLFADKPIRIGDFCRYGDEYGTVEEIGLRSTRLRRLDDTLVSLPNADFSQRELTNYTRRRQRLYQTTLGLRYETTPDQLRYVIAKLREMLLDHPEVSPDWLHVRFHSFGAYSLDIVIFAYIRTPEWLKYRAIREDINLKIMEIVKQAGTGFAFPSQTAYFGRDPGLDDERGRQAETEVQAWRSNGQAPLAEEDILDQPQDGSPGFKRRAGSSAPPPAETKRTGRQRVFGAKRR